MGAAATKKAMAKPIVHIASRGVGAVQECGRCGLVIVDHSETNQRFFTIGSFLVNDGDVFRPQGTDATDNQQACEALPVESAESLPKKRWRRYT
jgi:hypothetical protein